MAAPTEPPSYLTLHNDAVWAHVRGLFPPDEVPDKLEEAMSPGELDQLADGTIALQQMLVTTTTTASGAFLVRRLSNAEHAVLLEVAPFLKEHLCEAKEEAGAGGNKVATTADGGASAASDDAPALAAFFEEAAKRASQADFPKASSNAKLELYGLFKRATMCSSSSSSRPGMMDPVGRAKFDAWAKCDGLGEAEARARYVALVQSVDPSFQTLVDSSGTGAGKAAAAAVAATATTATQESLLVHVLFHFSVDASTLAQGFPNNSDSGCDRHFVVSPAAVSAFRHVPAPLATATAATAATALAAPATNPSAAPASTTAATATAVRAATAAVGAQQEQQMRKSPGVARYDDVVEIGAAAHHAEAHRLKVRRRRKGGRD